MRVRTPASDRADSASSTQSTIDSSSGSRLARYVLVAGGVVALAYAIRRFRGSSDDGDGIQSVDEFQERAAEAVPDELSEPVATIPIGEPGDEAEPETPAADEGGDETETNADVTDDERSDEEIAERAEPDVSAEPAEPGEMAIDEEVAEELVDDESEAESEDEGNEESAASEE
ncbi:hypothetical protein [Natrinema sp. 1APR25-10V2]|uniref:hypothetical protein n=1 Tax=Natrinema sp. 1APR25-10V2 TaxID=2951081 RepID=UPI0028749814|nr:hypothetical protein [Natrinema sp. 1APR25-10V2]MDS0475441.1 hypothetical protein [Natrinema sp. 1APR25-10V2]